MNFGDSLVTTSQTDLVSLEEHVGMTETMRRFESVGGELDEEAQRILEVDRIHEASVLDAAMLYLAFVEAGNRLCEGRARDSKRNVMHAPRLGRRTLRHGPAGLVREYGDQPAIAGIEVEVTFVPSIEIGLLENEGHTEETLPEINRCLAVGPGQCYVMDTLTLQLLHESLMEVQRLDLACVISPPFRAEQVRRWRRMAERSRRYGPGLILVDCY
jgi:hypothetical protein